MKRNRLLALAAGASLSLVSVAMANPRESVNFTGVNSMNVLNNAENVTKSASFTGGYPVGKLRITGTVHSEGVMRHRR